jgi:hypothetical protein
MRRNTVIVFLLAAGFVPIRATVIEIGGPIYSDTTWTGPDTILVTANVTVDLAARLTVESGSVVLFQPARGLTVGGELLVYGVQGDHVLFSSSSDTAGGSPQAGQWAGVNFAETSNGSLDYCDIKYAVNGVLTYAGSLETRYCTVSEFSGRGYYVVGATEVPQTRIVIDHGVITQTQPAAVGRGIGVFVFRGCDVTIRDTDIHNCSQGIEFYGYGTVDLDFDVVNCDLRHHSLRGIYAHSGG